MSKKNKEYDQNVIAAVKALPIPLKTSNGHEVRFDVDKRNETIFEHIANKEHHIHVKDVAVIPQILQDKASLKIGTHSFRIIMPKVEIQQSTTAHSRIG